MSSVTFAFTINILTALFIVLGTFIGIKLRSGDIKILSLVLGFSGGIMLYLAFVEIFHEGMEILSNELGSEIGRIISILGFFAGIIIVALLDRFIPKFKNDEDDKIKNEKTPFACLYRVGVFSALTIGIHNIPEGFSTFIAAFKNQMLGISLGTGIGIHNISVGLAIGIPIYLATNSKLKALLFSTASAFMSLVGGALAYYFKDTLLNNAILGIIFSMIAGMMIFVSLDEILPTAEKYGDHHLVIYGIIGGMFIMAISLIKVQGI